MGVTESEVLLPTLQSRNLITTCVALILIVVSFIVLERTRQGVDIHTFTVGDTPVTSYATTTAADAPVIVVAHGFAGSQQMMQGYALPLARAGYRVFAFEFLGHGRHPAPMSGDVTTIDGTTRLLVDQTNAVIDAVATDGAPLGLLGHSMATDILVRTAQTRDDIGPIVLISAFSQVITGNTPDQLLLISGAWEAGLRAFGLEAAQMVDPNAHEGETVSAAGISRRAVAAPFSEHVSVLHSRVGRRAAVDWMDTIFQRGTPVAILPTGWAILGLLMGVVLLFRGVAACLPDCSQPPHNLSVRQLAAVIVIPMLAAPLVAVPLNPSFLPVLVADYLGLHLLLFGAIQLALLRYWRIAPGGIAWGGFGLLMLWCAAFGGLDRYAANFWPTPGRLWIIAVMVIGALPFMVADAILTTSAVLWRRVAIRLGFLVSLGIAVACDFEGLFFLIMIAPVMVLFYLVFGSMGRAAGRRSGPLAPGLALGLVLAWVLGVSFPLFQA